MDASPFVLALDHHLATRPEAVAIVADQRSVTWRELDQSSRAHARQLAALGIGAGDRVAVQLPSSPELVAIVLAHLRLGVVHVPVNARYQRDEVAHIVAHSGARVLLTELEAALEPLAAWPAAPVADTPALLVYTSGTTGPPKGVMLSHRGLAENLGAMMTQWQMGEGDVLSLALPLFHVHGLGLGVLGALVLSGARLRLHARFAAEAVIDDAHAGASVFMGVPTMYHGLLEHLDAAPHDAEALRGMRLFTAGSAALAARDFTRFFAHTGHAILERYGMTETGFTLSNPYVSERRAGTVGHPVTGVRVRVVDDAGVEVGRCEIGAIEVHGPGLMDGYWQDAAATEDAYRDGWFQTGDVAQVDADGYHWIVGRASTDIIKSGGFKIGAREIEDVLRFDTRLVDVSVLGVPDAKWGEAIVAVVVARDGVSLPPEVELLQELRELVAQHLADFKRPRAVRVLGALPRNAMGKVTKHALRALF